MDKITSKSWQEIRSKKPQHKGDLFVKKRFSHNNFIFKVYRKHPFEERLLLAAPDLLDVLRQAIKRETAIATGNWPDEDMKDWVLPAQLLIHKIEGEPEEDDEDNGEEGRGDDDEPW